MEKWIVLSFVLMCFAGCARQMLTMTEIDELFETNFESTGLYRGEDKFPFGYEPVYCLKGPFEELDRSMVVRISKENNVNLMTQSLGIEVKTEEVLPVDDLEVKVKLVKNRLIECEENHYVPYYIVELKTDQGYFGFRINSKNCDIYEESEGLKDADRLWIKKMIEIVFHLHEAQHNR